MANSKKIDSCSKFKPNNTLKKNGIIWRRYVFNGIESGAGSERMFFVELEMLNPYLSPDEPVLGFKERSTISEDDLQYALAGTKAAYDHESETFVNPSYVAVRAGVFGQNAKQVCSYFSIKHITGGFHSSGIECGPCSFDDDRLHGEITCTAADIQEHPEYLCDAGSAAWDLRFETLSPLQAGYAKKTDVWIPGGARSVFAGSFVLDGHEYHVDPKKSYGYYDLNAGHSLPLPWFHLSATNLTSLISGKTLFNSCFAVQGLYEDSLALSVMLENNLVSIKANKGRHAVKPLWECTQMPADEEGEKLHWSVSSDTKKWVIDIDIFCLAKQLFVRNIELPEGGRKVMKQLAGGTGTGEIRLYHHVGKNLELIEDAHVANALCEFGQIELPEQ